MSRKWFAVLALALATAAFPHGASAAYWDINIQPWGALSYPLGSGENVETYGQTFDIAGHADSNVLQDFTFWLQKSPTETSPDPVKFEAYVYAWDGAKATTELWHSGKQELSSKRWAPYTFTPLDLTLDTTLYGTTKYIAFVSASGYASPSAAGMQILATGGYDKGNFVWMNNGDNTSYWTTPTTNTNWNTLAFDEAQKDPVDAVFNARFYGPGQEPRTPEPASLALIGMGLLAPGLRRRRAAKKAKKA